MWFITNDRNCAYRRARVLTKLFVKYHIQLRLALECTNLSTPKAFLEELIMIINS